MSDIDLDAVENKWAEKVERAKERVDAAKEDLEKAQDDNDKLSDRTERVLEERGADSEEFRQLMEEGTENAGRLLDAHIEYADAMEELENAREWLWQCRHDNR